MAQQTSEQDHVVQFHVQQLPTINLAIFHICLAIIALSKFSRLKAGECCEVDLPV